MCKKIRKGLGDTLVLSQYPTGSNRSNEIMKYFVPVNFIFFICVVHVFRVRLVCVLCFLCVYGPSA